jgi:hypothetical protein
MGFVRKRSRRETDLEEEIQSHLRMAEQDCLDRGENPEQAKYRARREFGNLDMVKETTREVWGWSRLDRLIQDLRYAVRQIRRNPGMHPRPSWKHRQCFIETASKCPEADPKPCPRMAQATTEEFCSKNGWFWTKPCRREITYSSFRSRIKMQKSRTGLQPNASISKWYPA